MPWYMLPLMLQSGQTTNNSPMDDLGRRITESLIKDWEEKQKKSKEEKKASLADLFKVMAILMAIGPLVAMGVIYVYFKVGVMFATGIMHVIK